MRKPKRAARPLAVSEVEVCWQGSGGCVQRRLSGKSFMPKHKWAARPLAVSEMARCAGSFKASAQAAGNAEVVAVVRCRGSGGGQREVVGMRRF